MNLDSEFTQIANELTRLFKDEIKRQGLIESGRLYNSIKFISKKTQYGYELVMTGVSYFKYIDEKYHISKNVYSSIEYKMVQKRIGKAYNLYIKEQIIQK